MSIGYQPGWLAPLLLAPFAGSFAGVLIRRLPAGRPVGLARSDCDSCRHVLAARDLVPLASYVCQAGRCRHCGQPIGLFYPAVELAALAIAMAAIAADGDDLPRVWAACGLGWSLLALAWIDGRHMRLPDGLTLPLLLAGLAVTWRLQPHDIGAHALGAAIGFLALAAVGAAYRGLRRREGIGRGDAKLLAAGGAWLGWAPLSWVVLLAAVLGLVLALVLRLRGRRIDRATALPFGPCLAAAIWAAFLYPP